jgi:hypothetical protein
MLHELNLHLLVWELKTAKVFPTGCKQEGGKTSYVASTLKIFQQAKCASISFSKTILHHKICYLVSLDSYNLCSRN